jgi:hypothetical protein
MEVLARFTFPVALAVTLSGLAAPAPAWALDPENAATSRDPELAEPPDPEGEGPGPEPAGAPTTAQPGPEAPSPHHAEENWLDIGHAFIEHRIFAPVLRVDRFFSDERDLEPERARSFLQWRQELRFQQHRSTPSYTTTVGASLKLPGLNQELRKLQVEITGQTRDAFTALFPGDHASPGEVPTTDSNFGTADAGIGYRLFETVARTVATHGDLGAGVTLKLPPGVHGRARVRFAESLGARVLARQAVTGFWRTDTGFGSSTSAELERPLAFSTLARLGGSATVTEKSRGFEWGGDLSLAATLRAHIGAQLGFGLSGASRAPVGVDVYRFYLRLRRDVYRKWIFAELAPEYAWPWEPVIGRRGVWAVVLRLEVQFQGNEAPRIPAPDEQAQPEPKDPVHPGPPSALPGAPTPG